MSIHEHGAHIQAPEKPDRAGENGKPTWAYDLQDRTGQDKDKDIMLVLPLWSMGVDIQAGSLYGFGCMRFEPIRENS